MSHGPTRISTKGLCIYCHSTNVDLTDEHILPYFIGGFHIINNASCKECAKITTKFERDVARGFWGDARNAYGAPTRRKKKRKKFIYLDDQINIGGKLKIPFNEYPAPMIFYCMGTAGLLLGNSESVDSASNWTFKAIVDQKKLEAFEKKYPGQLTTKVRFPHDSFAKLIIKIGYGQILCSLDPGDFRPICLPYLFGKKTNYSYIVGSRKSIPEPEPGLGYIMRSHCIGTSDYLLLVAEIRIIANNHTPAYHVVVGDVSGENQVSYVRKKIQAVYDVIIPDNSAGPQYTSDEFHWAPQIWPLPVQTECS